LRCSTEVRVIDDRDERSHLYQVEVHAESVSQPSVVEGTEEQLDRGQSR
jgi:hypothetical protein